MASQDPDAPASVESERAITAEVTASMVRLYKELFGRGPTRARSDFAGPDTLICTLWDTLTPAERGLIDVGQRDRARETRIMFQYSRQQEFISAVETLLGRTVNGFVSGIDVVADVAAEVFYLA